MPCSFFGRCKSKKKSKYTDDIDSIDITWKDTTPFVAPITQGKVIKVYDGDTITVAARLPYKGSLLYRFSVRLNGIDTPEIRGKNEDEKQCAQLAKKALSDIILGKTVQLREVKTEKYGRLLADVYFGNLCLNKWMIEEKYAVEYDGGTKISPPSWMYYHKTGKFLSVKT